MKTYELEYYDRKTNYYGIGTFYVVGDKHLKKGDIIIVPREGIIDGDVKRNNGKAGHCEGRVNHPAYLKPLLLEVRSQNETHIITNGNGSWARDICLIEKE